MNTAPPAVPENLTGDVLQPYDPTANGGWSRRDARHLLCRAQFGATYEEIEKGAAAGLEATLDRLTKPQLESDEFVSAEGLLRRNADDTANIVDLKSWWLYRMLNSANPLVEKMSLLWHNQFATSNSKVKSVPHMAAQNDLIRQHALGSFRGLLHGMTRDVAMLIWLDGNANRKRQANENFAREVLELFSLGVGNYTEQDIKEAARAFTGWHVRDSKFWFNNSQHDQGEKKVFGKTGNLDGGDVIELCLAQPACPRFLAEKLLRGFVTPQPAREWVDQLAGRIRAHDFQMAPLLRELFGSRLFFSHPARSGIIKSPLDLVLGSYRVLGNRPKLQPTVLLLADLGQDVFQPPTVKGWEGGRFWISSATLLQRANFAADLLTGDNLGSLINPEAFVSQHNWSAPDEVVRQYAELLLSHDVDPATLSQLENFVKQAQGDRNVRLRGMIQLIMTMPDYQLG